MKNEKWRMKNKLSCMQPTDDRGNLRLHPSSLFFILHPYFSFFILHFSFFIKILHNPSLSFTHSPLRINKFDGMKDMKDKKTFFSHGLFTHFIAQIPSAHLSNCPDSISFPKNSIKWKKSSIGWKKSSIKWNLNSTGWNFFSVCGLPIICLGYSSG